MSGNIIIETHATIDPIIDDFRNPKLAKANVQVGMMNNEAIEPPMKKFKQYTKTEDQYILESLQMDLQCLDMNNLRSVKYKLLSCSLETIEVFYNSIKIPDDIPNFFDQWSSQTKENVFISNIFFPMEIEEPNDTLNYIYEKKRVHKKLAICCKNNDPLSMLHFSKILEHYYEDEDESEIRNICLGLAEKSKEYFKKTLTEGDVVPYFAMGEFCRLLGNESVNYYEKGDDIRCKYKIAVQNNDRNEQEIISKTFPPAKICLGNAEKDQDKAVKYFVEAGEAYVPYGYFKAGNLLLRSGKTEQGLEYLHKAAEKGISSAYMILGLYYHDLSNYNKEKEIYKKAGENDVPHAYIKLGKMYENKNKIEKAKKFYQFDALGGYKYSLPLENNENAKKFKAKSMENLNKYFISLIKN